MKTIKCKSVLTGLKNGEKPVNRYVHVNNGTVHDDTIYSGVSRKSGQPLPLVKATGAMIFGEIGENLQHGYRVEMDELSAFLTVPGSVESVSAESRNASSLTLSVHLLAKGGLKTCCQGPEFVIENITKGATVIVDGVIGENQVPDMLQNGTDVLVHVTGRGLYMPDLADPTVGAYIAGSDGKVLVKANVTESSATTLTCTFPQIDLEEGTYRFCVASRNGLDPAQYGVTIGSRNIRVANDAQADEEVHDGQG